MSKTFIEQCLKGECLLDEIDDFVEKWHTSAEFAGKPLSEFLGLTDEEYKLWVEKPEALSFIVLAHRFNIKIPEALAVSGEQNIAARASGGRETAKELLAWLHQTGRI